MKIDLKEDVIKPFLISTICSIIVGAIVFFVAIKYFV